MPISNAHKFIIAPMCSGKTTIINKYSGHSIQDVDAARNPYAELILKRLRSSRDWDAHNALWYDMIARWAAALPVSQVILTHDVGSVDAIDPRAVKQGRVVAVIIDPDQWQSQVEKRRLSHDDLLLANINRDQVIEQASRYKLLACPTFEQALEVLGIDLLAAASC